MPGTRKSGYIEAREQHAFDNRQRDTSVHAMTSEAGPILSNTSVARSHPIERERKEDAVYTYIRQARQRRNGRYIDIDREERDRERESQRDARASK